VEIEWRNGEIWDFSVGRGIEDGENGDNGNRGKKWNGKEKGEHKKEDTKGRAQAKKITKPFKSLNHWDLFLHGALLIHTE
jgi:hypothetical protein